MATTTAQNRSFTDPAGHGARYLSFDQFDPALGELTGVRVGVAASVAHGLSVESLEARESWVSYLYSGQVSVFGPDGQLLVQSGAGGSGAVVLTGFDGGSDYGGASGAVLTSVDQGAASVVNLAGAQIDAAFTGAGTVALAVGDVGRNYIQGPANMRVLAETSVGGEVALEYDYTPPVVGGWVGNSYFQNDTNFSVIYIKNDTDYTGIIGPRPVTATTAAQVFQLASKTTGWQDAVSVAAFDPALGTLASVQIRLSTTLQASANIENHVAAAGSAWFAQAAATTLSLGGASVLEAKAEADRWLEFGAADGSDDFAGAGGAQDGGVAATKVAAVTLGAQATLDMFTLGGPVVLEIGSVGTGTISGLAGFLAEMTALSGAVVEVAYTYLVDDAAAAVLVDAGAGGEAVAAQAYGGPVTEVQHEFIRITPGNLTIAANTDNWFIRTGDGTDAIAARGGTNVIDGGAGSNFLSGGFGADTFFVDVRGGTQDVWSTVANFGHGDRATVWGVTPEDFSLVWVDGEGAAGATGLTLHALPGTGPNASLTLAGYTTADLTNGRLAVSFGVSDGGAYLHVAAS